MQRFIGDRPLAGAVVEFGTRGIAINSAHPLDQWLRNRGSDFRKSERFHQLQTDLRDAYVPVSHEWRNRVLNLAVDITDQAVAGLSKWDAA